MSDPMAAIAALDELTQTLQWLAASLLPGTHRPWRPPVIPEDKRDEIARLDRELRHNLGYGMLIPLGESPAPMDLAVMDLLSEILVVADEIAEQVSVAVQRPVMGPAHSAFADPSPFLAMARENLRLACTVDDTLAGWVERRCDSLVFRAHTQLGLLGDGQILTAVCPWCGGRTAKQPAGGELTMRVRAQLPAGHKSVIGVDPTDVRWLVVCESGLCEPPEADCGERHRGRPAWPLGSEGGWLADRLERATG